MSCFPDEVILEILSRLPVKPLLRFRCVSKPWLALIDSPEFIKFHLKHSLTTNTNLSLILRSSKLYSSDFDSLDGAIELDHPLKTPGYGIDICGSCNGLLCLSNSEDDVALWNPSTRKFKKLPVTTMDFPDGLQGLFYCKSVYGFGYDETSDDYKVLKLFQLFVGDDTNSVVKVYSLKNDSWNKVPDCPYNLYYPCSFGTLASGALHWLVNPKVKSDRTNLILAFDLAVEEYRLVPQPDFYDKNSSMDVGVLGGCLTILYNHNRHRLDVWVMKEYGVKESWTKLYSVQPFEYMFPVAYSKCGEEVLLEKVMLEKNSKRLVWYDLKNNKRVKNVKIRGVPDWFEPFICWGSLVPLGGNREGNAKKQQVGEKKKRKKR
uniref:F-box domain-containing protein n=1 Tax=Fagus sylvatica TaxID=28930 RepID=A0A2N9IDC3_FAGSY